MGRSVAAVPIPAESRVREAYARTHLADAFEAPLPDGAVRDPATLARFIFVKQPRWVSRLMRLRDLIVGTIGLKTADGLRRSSDKRIGIFKVYATHPTEIVMGEDDRHLDFRVSVLVRPEALAGDGTSAVVVSTVVHCHNLVGRCYLLVIAPFHRQVVQAGLRRAAASGWPMRTTTEAFQGLDGAGR